MYSLSSFLTPIALLLILSSGGKGGAHHDADLGADLSADSSADLSADLAAYADLAKPPSLKPPEPRALSPRLSPRLSSPRLSLPRLAPPRLLSAAEKPAPGASVVSLTGDILDQSRIYGGPGQVGLREEMETVTGSGTRLLWVMSSWEDALSSQYSTVEHLGELTGMGLASDLVLGRLVPVFGGGVTSEATARSWEFTAGSTRKKVLEYLEKDRAARLWLSYAPTPKLLSMYGPSGSEQAESLVEYLEEMGYTGGVVVDVREEQLLVVEKNLQFFATFIAGLRKLKPSMNIGVLIRAEMLNTLQRTKTDDGTVKSVLLTGKKPTMAADANSPPITIFVYYDNSKYPEGDSEEEADELYEDTFGYQRAISIPMLAGVSTALKDSPHGRRFVLARALMDEAKTPKHLDALLARARVGNGYDSGLFIVDSGMPYPLVVSASSVDYSEEFLQQRLPKLAGYKSSGRRARSLYEPNDFVSIPTAANSDTPIPTATANAVYIESCETEMTKPISYYVPLCKSLCTTLVEGKFCEVTAKLSQCVINKSSTCKPRSG